MIINYITANIPNEMAYFFLALCLVIIFISVVEYVILPC
jgi:hypothetical protein